MVFLPPPTVFCFLTSPIISCPLFSLLPSSPLPFSFILFSFISFISSSFLLSTNTDHRYVYTDLSISFPAGSRPLSNLLLQLITHNLTRLNFLEQNAGLLNSFPKMHYKIVFYYLFKIFLNFGIAGALIIYPQLIF